MDFSIGEVAKMLDVSPQILRIWEQNGLILKPHRRPTNIRRYTEADIEAIQDYLTKRKK